MSSIQHKRKEAILFRTISEIISEEITNANVSYPTVTSIQLSRDNSHLSVFVTFENNKERSLEALNAAKGFVRSKISKMPNLRKVPAIDFKLDNSYEEGRKIEEILKKIKESEKK